MSTNSRFAVAVHVLSLMAWSGEEPLKSEQVADSVNTHPVVIRRILKELAEAGLVVSQTGSLGGSRLAHDPSQTTLLDVYQALEYGGVFSLHSRLEFVVLPVIAPRCRKLIQPIKLVAA